MGKGESSRSAFNFNKQILLAELGALLFSFFSAFTASKFFHSHTIVAKFALAGSVFGAAVFWIGSRIMDNSKHEVYTSKDLLHDMSYFTPVAFLLTISLYYPPLYYLTNLFLGRDHMILFSVVFAQIIACCLFLIAINIYRHYLIKFLGKHL